MDDASRVREKIDIVTLIGEYIPLKKMGRNFTVICPFHSEKTPSFVVSPERQIWHCFGCGKGGDAFTFLMEYEGMEFIEALKVLAKKTGVVIKDSYSGFSSSKKEKFYKLNKIAQEFYSYILLNHKVGERALDYLLQKRGLNKKLIEYFGIGFSPGVGTALSDYLVNKKKLNKQELIEAGLVFDRGGKIYDFFRGRIIFPLTDSRGNILGFSGRVLDDSQMPKYINTKETLIYHKGDMFFALDKTKEAIKKEGAAIIVEGEFDLTALFKEGIKNVVSIKGTALTDKQAELLSRIVEKVVLCLDQDSAGFEATKKSVAVLEKKNLLTNVVVTPGAKDPDEAIKNNPGEFKKSLKNTLNAYEFLIESFSKKYGTQSVESKKKITGELLPLISLVQNEIIKEHYLKKLASKIDISMESLLKEEQKIGKQKEEEKYIIPTSKDRRGILEEYLLSLIIQSDEKEKILTEIKKDISEYKFKIVSFEKILNEMEQYLGKYKTLDFDKFSKTLGKELLPLFDKCFLVPIYNFDNFKEYMGEVKNVTLELLKLYFKEKTQDLGEKLKKPDSEDKNQKEKLTKELNEVVEKLSSLAS